MAIDLRTGRGDRFVRYDVFAINLKKKEVLENKTEPIARFYGKDMTPSNYRKVQIGNVTQSSAHEITIETMDQVNLVPNQLILSHADGNFYIIKTILEETVNTSQQLSRRPVTKRTITIRRG